MKIPKFLIIKCADNLIMKHGKVSQIEVHAAIEKLLNRNLTRYEKTRITQILHHTYVRYGTKIGTKTKRRIIYFG